jgi:hypothetical protein
MDGSPRPPGDARGGTNGALNDSGGPGLRPAANCPIEAACAEKKATVSEKFTIAEEVGPPSV